MLKSASFPEATDVPRQYFIQWKQNHKVSAQSISRPLLGNAYLFVVFILTNERINKQNK
jgi:hypothetical protein